jgi:hypothetical protein
MGTYIILNISHNRAMEELSTSLITDKMANPIKIGNVSNKFFNALFARCA